MAGYLQAGTERADAMAFQHLHEKDPSVHDSASTLHFLDILSRSSI